MIFSSFYLSCERLSISRCACSVVAIARRACMKHWTLNLDVFQMNFLAFDRLLKLYLVTLLTQINLYNAAVLEFF